MLSQQESQWLAVKTIKDECAKAGLIIVRLFLFGSRARGEASGQSDWDFYVCVQSEPSFSAKAKVASAIRTKCAEKHISVDIVIKSEQKMRQERDNVGMLTHYALKEAIAL